MSRENIENTLNSTAFLHQILLIIMLLTKLLKRREIYVYIYIYIYIYNGSVKLTKNTDLQK